MKASIFQLVSSSVVLGLMAGAVGLHWHEVERMDPAGTVGAHGGGTGVGAAFETPGVDFVPVSSTGGAGRVEQSHRKRVDGVSPEMGATVEALTEIVSVLRELKDENRNLREQVKEANRDLTEMQFRLDTHSKSFRPLNVVSEPAKPLETVTSHPLLPPKRR